MGENFDCSERGSGDPATDAVREHRSCGDPTTGAHSFGQGQDGPNRQAL